MRARLIMRVYVALLREIDRNKDMIGETSLVLNAAKRQTEESPETVLNFISISMTTSILNTMGSSNPLMFRSCAEALLEIFRCDSSKVLAKCKVGSMQENAIRSVISCAENVCARTRQQDRSLALGLMLAAAVSSGSLEDMLKVVKGLHSGPEKLSEKAYPFVKRLNDCMPDLALHVPCQESLTVSFTIRSEMKQTGGYLERPPSLTTDGIYLYAWNGKSCCIYKFGTDFHGSAAGNQELVSERLDLAAAELLKDKADPILGSPSKHTHAQIAWANNKLYLYMKSVLGPFRVAILSPQNLTIDDIVEIDFPVKKFQEVNLYCPHHLLLRACVPSIVYCKLYFSTVHLCRPSNVGKTSWLASLPLLLIESNGF